MPAANKKSLPIEFRYEVKPSDVAALADMAMKTGFFYDHEVVVAAELLTERLEKGRASGYEFVLAEVAGAVAGYTCFGEIPCTTGSYDLYWIVVARDKQGCGIGRALVQETERKVAELGGRKIYIETSSRPQYEPTRGFYLATGYEQVAFLPEFYGTGDGKLIYVRSLS